MAKLRKVGPRNNSVKILCKVVNIELADLIIPRTSNDFSYGGYNDTDMRYRHGLEVRNWQDHFQNFNRYYTIFPHMEMDGLIQYVFITRPDLNIVEWNRSSSGRLTDKAATDPIFQEAFRDHRILLRSLSSSFAYDHDFIPFLSPRVESLQLSDVSLRTSSFVQPATGYETTYGGNAIESSTSCSFDITFRDDNGYRLLKTFQYWVHYIDMLYQNKISPKEEYIRDNVFDYMVSIYKFDCAPDGASIIFYQKYTGCFPTGIPLSSLSFNAGGSPENKITIPFRAQHLEPYNPLILRDFNRNSNGTYRAVPMYDNLVNGTGDPIVGAPFVVREGSTFKLRWRPRKTSFM